MTTRETLTSSTNHNTPKLAIIGCGAIADTFYLPAFAKIASSKQNLILVDKNIDQARKLAERFGIQNVRSDVRDVLGSVKGAIVAVPHHLHYAIAAEFLSGGHHVLCEKPLTETTAQARELTELAYRNKVTLSVNMTRRLMSSSEKVKELLNVGAIGKLRSMSYIDGAEFNWPTASGFYFDYRLSQRGVLMDIGAHVLDLICWWLGGRPEVISSENDSFGGCEAVSSLRLAHDGCTIDIRMSRLAKLANRYQIVGEQGRIDGAVYRGNVLTVTKGKTSQTINVGTPTEGMSDYADRLVRNFIDVIEHGTPPIVAGEHVLNSIELVEEAYSKAKRFSLPWYEVKENAHAIQQ